MTLAQVQCLVQRPELVDELNWNRTATTLSLTANVHRSTNSPVIRPDEFHPYSKTTDAQPVDASVVDQMKNFLNG
tara:strand:- start:12395 stop:12619 length:225 start_codon:yes stop_codon:yes gene_type:complete